MDCDPAINQPIYQYFTIINNYGNNEQPRENEDNNQIVYLTFNPGHDVDEEASTSNSNVFNSESQEDYNTLPSGSLDEDIKYIKLEDGTMLLTTEEKDLVEDDEDQQSKSAFDLDENDKSINCNLDYTDYEILIDAENASSSMIEMVYCDETSTANEEIEVKKEKRFKCCYDGCEKEYNTSYALTVHMRSHKGCKPYICAAEGCDKKFSTNYSLKAHIRTHTGEKPYGCTVCEKHFKTSGDLQKHIRIHTGEKPFVCPIEGCGKSFTTSNIRKVHIRSHTGERPYICEYRDCGKAFSSSTNYKNHIRIHSGEKPYVCSVPGCCKRFTEYSSLYKHNLVHQPSRPYDCAYCNQRFKQESALNMHKRVRHDVIVTHDGIEIVVQIGN